MSLSNPECICPNHPDHIEWIEFEFDRSKVVFIGKAKNPSGDHETFEVKVLKCYKGDLKEGTVVMAINDYGPCISEVASEGKWLLYGSVHEDRFYSNECGMSRSFEQPILYPIPPPPVPDNFDRDSIATHQMAQRILVDYFKEEEDRLCFEIAYLEELSNKQ